MRTAPAITAIVLATGGVAAAAPVNVTNSSELVAAIDSAAPGDVITLAPGTYDLAAKVRCDAAGTASEPIVVRAASLGDALIRSDTVELFAVTQPYWVFENLDVQGVCANDSDCEHAFHITGEASNTIVRNNRLHDFNAQIKGNSGNDSNGIQVWPNDVVIEGNELFNGAERQTSNPVTTIDVVGGRRWALRANFIHDHAKGMGNEISYAAFLKGNSKDGVIERNLVVCELLHTGRVRIGLSFGGGGSAPDNICEEGTCTPEHDGGIMRNNIVVGCTDVGIYLNEAANVGIYNNTLYMTTGIDVRFAASVADVRNNILSDQIRERDSGSATLGTNLTQVSDSDFRAWFADPDNYDFSLTSGTAFIDLGETLADVTDDYCANDRDDGMNDLGAVEYDGDGPCDTTTTHPGAGTGPGAPDAGPGGGADGGGNAGTDAGSSGGGSDSGCGCHTSGGGGSSAVLLVLALALSRRRRRTSRYRG